MSNNNNEKVMEISHSDVLNALFHAKLHEQHFATQESVDNLKERFIDFSARTDSNFEKVDESFKRVDAEFKEVRAEIKEVRTEIKELSNRMDDKFRWVIGTMCSGFIAMLAVMLGQLFTK